MCIMLYTFRPTSGLVVDGQNVLEKNLRVSAAKNCSYCSHALTYFYDAHMANHAYRGDHCVFGN